MIETTEVTCGSDLAFPQNWPCQWHIFVQRQVSAGVIVVVGVGAKHAAQMKLPSWCGLLIRYALTNINADEMDSGYSTMGVRWVRVPEHP